MLDNVRLDFSGDQQLLDLLLALISIGDTLDRWLPTPGEASGAPMTGPEDPFIDGVLGILSVRETLRRGLVGAGISPQTPSQRQSQPAGPVAETTPTAAREYSTFLR